MKLSKRVKTQGSRLESQLSRQKSIFSSLNWQMQQRDKKIIFLQKYYVDLQRFIDIQKRKQKDLQEKIQMTPISYKKITPKQSKQEKQHLLKRRRIQTEPEHHATYINKNYYKK